MVRPLKFQSISDLQCTIDAYFADCIKDGVQVRPYSITGLALALDTCRQTLLNYEEKPEFVDAIKRAKLRVENYYEERLPFANATGPIFALKNFDWKDSQDHTIGSDPNKPLRVESDLSPEAIARMERFINKQSRMKDGNP